MLERQWVAWSMNLPALRAICCLSIDGGRYATYQELGCCGLHKNAQATRFSSGTQVLFRGP